MYNVYTVTAQRKETRFVAETIDAGIEWIRENAGTAIVYGEDDLEHDAYDCIVEAGTIYSIEPRKAH